MPSAADDSVARAREAFDSFDAEWERLRKDVHGRVSFEIHRRFLDEYLTPGARVLEVGAGPGTFTQHMALHPSAHRDRSRTSDIAEVAELIAEYGDDAGDAILRTGDLRPVQPTGHVCVMYRAEQIPGFVAQSGGALAGMSASNWSSLGDPQALTRLEADPAHWARFLDNEAWACRQPGCLNGGTHLIFAARNKPDREPGRRDSHGRIGALDVDLEVVDAGGVAC